MISSPSVWQSARPSARRSRRCASETSAPSSVMAERPVTLRVPPHLLLLTIAQHEEIIVVRTQIDFGDVTFQDTFIHDQVLEDIEFLPPSFFRQLDDDIAVQEKIPPPFRHALIADDARDRGA